MILRVDPHSGLPVYRQLMNQIRFQIAGGMLRPGDELPSTRTLSARLGVNPMTVSKAFSLLEGEGLLERRPGLPLVVREREDDEVKASKLERLRERLRPAATAAAQLGVSDEEALALFRKLLDDTRR
jgi:GntR family transcriptional regulator